MRPNPSIKRTDSSKAGCCRSFKRYRYTLRNVWYSLRQGSRWNAGASLLSPCIIEARTARKLVMVQRTSAMGRVSRA
jgi:hypothetical protein